MARALRRRANSGLKKGGWTLDEDYKLVSYIQKYGIWIWSYMAAAAGLSRSGKSCRLRWMNYLRPDLKHGNFTVEENRIILDMYSLMESRWAAIAAKLPGRSDNEIKNHWHTNLKKQYLKEKNHKSLTPLKQEIVSKFRLPNATDVLSFEHPNDAFIGNFGNQNLTEKQVYSPEIVAENFLPAQPFSLENLLMEDHYPSSDFSFQETINPAPDYSDDSSKEFWLNLFFLADVVGGTKELDAYF